jgi:hypothetical protein
MVARASDDDDDDGEVLRGLCGTVSNRRSDADKPLFRLQRHSLCACK